MSNDCIDSLIACLVNYPILLIDCESKTRECPKTTSLQKSFGIGCCDCCCGMIVQTDGMFLGESSAAYSNGCCRYNGIVGIIYCSAMSRQLSDVIRTPYE